MLSDRMDDWNKVAERAFISHCYADLTSAVQVRTQLMTMMSVLEKSLVTIHPDRNKIENAELRQRIVDAYHQSKVSCCKLQAGL